MRKVTYFTLWFWLVAASRWRAEETPLYLPTLKIPETMRCFGCYSFLFYFEKAQLGKAGIFWKPAFTPTLPVWRILIALLDKRSHTQTLCFSMVKLNYGLEKRHNMEPVPLPNDILCPGFTDILSVILQKFAIMPVSSAKKVPVIFSCLSNMCWKKT